MRLLNTASSDRKEIVELKSSELGFVCVQENESGGGRTRLTFLWQSQSPHENMELVPFKPSSTKKSHS